MTSISITNTLMSNYATIALLGDNFYNKAEVDNLITFDPNVVYTKQRLTPF